MKDFFLSTMHYQWFWMLFAPCLPAFSLARKKRFGSALGAGAAYTAFLALLKRSLSFFGGRNNAADLLRLLWGVSFIVIPLVYLRRGLKSANYVLVAAMGLVLLWGLGALYVFWDVWTAPAGSGGPASLK